MSGDQLNLDAIEARAERAHRQKERLLDAHGPTHQEATLLRSAMDVPALVAEVRRLQAEKDAILGQSEQAYRLLRISGDLGPAATLLAQMKRWPEFVERP